LGKGKKKMNTEPHSDELRYQLKPKILRKLLGLLLSAVCVSSKTIPGPIQLRLTVKQIQDFKLQLLPQLTLFTRLGTQ
jgi:hypothetical protein